MGDSGVPQAEPAFVWLRLSGATAYLLAVLLALVLNLLLSLALFRGSERFRKIAFYQIIWQLVASDILAQISQLLIAVPITYAGRKVYGDSLAFYLLAATETFGYYGAVHFNFLLALNRFLVFCAPSVDRVLFERPRIHVVIACTWIYVCVMLAMLNIGGCTKNFSEKGFYFFHNCVEVSSWRRACRRYVDIASQCVPYFIVLLHLMTIVRLRVDMARAEHRRRQSGYTLQGSGFHSAEKKFAIQCLLINATIIIEYIAFNLAPYIPPLGQWTFVINFAINLLSIFNNMTSPIILFGMNADIRKTLSSLGLSMIKVLPSQ